MKNLLLTLEYPPQKGGIATYLDNLVKELPPSKIIVLAPRVKNSFLFDQKQKYKIYRQPLFHNFWWPKWTKSINLSKEVIKKEKIDHLIISHILPMGYVALRLNIPFSVILHGTDILLAKKNDWRKFWLDKILNKANQIIVNSEFTKLKVLEEGIDASKIILAYPTPKKLDTPSPKIIQKLKLKHQLNGKKILLSVNRLVPRKGNDLTIEAVNKLKSNLSNFKYLIIGQGPYKPLLEKKIKKYHLEEFVEIITGVSDQELPAYYQLSDIFIMPARLDNHLDVEGFGIVYLEAALFKKPSIAGQAGGAPEAVIDGKTGLLVDPNDANDLAMKIAILLQNKQLRKKMGENAYNRTIEEFTPKKQFQKIVDKLTSKQ